jgi:hypothetical protein
MPSDFGALQRQCWRRNDAKISKLPSLHFVEFVAAGVAESSQQINRAIDGHFAQFDEVLVRLQIGVRDLSGDLFSTRDGAGVWRADRHAGRRRIAADMADLNDNMMPGPELMNLQNAALSTRMPNASDASKG